MRKIIMTTIISTLIVAVVATFGIQHFTQASTVAPYDADVDHDGHVTILDLSNVARYYGQPAPLATATAAPPTIVGNRSFASGGLLVDTTDGSIVATMNNPYRSLIRASCDGAHLAIGGLAYAGSGNIPQELQVIDAVTGTVLATSPTFSSGANVGALFPCPLKSAGGALTGGSPTLNRAILTWTIDSNTSQVMIFDVSSGNPIYTGQMLGGPSDVRLTCANDAIMFTIGPLGNSSDLIRLTDGALIANVPSAGLLDPTC
jgi:hypothetical protein